MFNIGSRLATYLSKSPSGTTFQKLINKQKFWQKVETNATVLTSIVAGGIFASQASNTALIPSFVGKVIGGVATISGYFYGYKIKKSYDKEIETLENLKALTNKEGMFLATADIEDVSDVSTWTNIAIIDRNNIDISTGHIIDGSNARKITNPFTLQAIVKVQYDNNEDMSYTIIGREIKETDAQLMSRFVEIEEGLKVYSNEIIEDVLLVYLTDGDIYRQVLKEYGYHQDGQAFLVKTLALKLSGQSVEGYVKEKLTNFKTTRWSFKSFDAQN